MPSVTIWNRIEPRARSLDMKAGLEARVFDPPAAGGSGRWGV